MSASVAGGTLLIVGSGVFFLGAAIGVPRVFTERDPRARLQMLQERLLVWRLAQVPYAIGPIVAGIGAGLLARGSDRPASLLFLAAGAVLLAGALAWSWDVYLRALRVPEFAYGTLPAWPFVSYVLLTNVGLAVLGAGLLVGDFPTWLGAITLGADALFVVAYVRWRDIPPFVFYLLLALVGAVVV